MSTKTKFNLILCNHMFHSHSILNPTFPTPSTFPSYAKELPQMNPHECVLCVNIWREFHICDRMYRFEINLCLFNQ